MSGNLAFGLVFLALAVLSTVVGIVSGKTVWFVTMGIDLLISAILLARSYKRRR